MATVHSLAQGRLGRINTLFLLSEKYPDPSQFPVVPFEIVEKITDNANESSPRLNATVTDAYSMRWKSE